MNSQGTFHAFRLRPHDDLKASINNFAKANALKAAAIVTCVGSLEQVHIRFANQPSGQVTKGHFEILTLSGTVSENGVHLHIMIADDHGRTKGGHLLDQNLIYTTAEIVLVELQDVRFDRELDNAYGYRELFIERRTS